MSKKGQKSPRSPLPWWLTGWEQCEKCLQVYALEVQVRCTHCDGPLCPMCVVEVQESSLRGCSDCAAAESKS